MPKLVRAPSRLAIRVIALNGVALLGSGSAAVAPALLANGANTSASTDTVRGQVADLRMDILEFRDPEFFGGVFHYGFAAVNDGPDAADGVEVVDDIPDGLAFARVEVSSSFGDPLDVPIEAPEVGQRGRLRISIGSILPGDWVNTTVYLLATAPPNTVVENTAVVSGIGVDPDLENNDIIVPYRIPVPPAVQFMRAYRTDSGSFRIRLSGSNFRPSGIGSPPFVYIGEEQTVWTSFKVAVPLKVVLKGGPRGRDLKRQFPRGVPVPIRLVNFDGGETTVIFTR